MNEAPRRDRGHLRLVQSVPGRTDDLQVIRQTLPEQRATLALLTEQMPAVLWSVDRHLVLTSVRGAGLTELGLDPDAIVGRSAHDLLGTADPRDERIGAHLQALRGESVSFQTRFLGRIFQCHMEPFRDDDGEITGAVGVALDITDRVNAEEQLRRSLELLREAAERQHRLMGQLVAAHEEERSRLSENIHDDTIQVVTTIGLRLDVLRHRIAEPEAVQDIDRLQHVVRNAVDRLRHLVFELRPPELDGRGLVPALRTYLAQNTDPDGPRYRLVDRLSREPPDPLRLTLYRMAQEALTNARKHSRASHVTVEVGDAIDGYVLRVVDDGVGCSPELALRPRPGHLGLAALRERAELVGGSLRVTSELDAGTTVEIRLPSA
jgi:PAS domain S-box-containing protein